MFVINLELLNSRMNMVKCINKVPRKNIKLDCMSTLFWSLSYWGMLILNKIIIYEDLFTYVILFSPLPIYQEISIS